MGSSRQQPASLEHASIADDSNIAMSANTKTTMTPNPSDLTSTQRQTINEFVAAKTGWKPPDHPDTVARTQGYCLPEKWWMNPSGEPKFRHDIPDLFASLDACAVAEKALFSTGDQWDAYVARLEDVCGTTEMEEDATDPIFSSAPQRALALYLTMGGVL